jgi:predicted nucleic acid-binding protein
LAGADPAGDRRRHLGVVDFFRDTGTWPVEHLAKPNADDEPIALTDIVLTEILQGLPSDREARRVERRLLAFDVLRLEALDDFRRAASLYRRARTSGITIDGHSTA